MGQNVAMIFGWHPHDFCYGIQQMAGGIPRPIFLPILGFLLQFTHTVTRPIFLPFPTFLPQFICIVAMLICITPISHNRTPAQNLCSNHINRGVRKPECKRCMLIGGVNIIQCDGFCNHCMQNRSYHVVPVVPQLWEPPCLAVLGVIGGCGTTGTCWYDTGTTWYGLLLVLVRGMERGTITVPVIRGWYGFEGWRKMNEVRSLSQVYF